MKVNKGTGVHDLDVRVAREDDDVKNTGMRPELDRTIQARIGDQLRAMYTELLEQPVPDRFADLIGRLEQGDGGGRVNGHGSAEGPDDDGETSR